MPPPALQPFVTGLAFPEALRWHGGALWFSDFYLQRVVQATPAGELRLAVELDDQPSGLGWLPDGRLLVVAMKTRRLLRLDPDGLRLHADLSGLAAWPCNDMLVDPEGGAWVGNFGFDLHARAPFAPTALLRITPAGEVRVAAADLHFPNGMALAPDGRTLIVAESYGRRLTAFDVDGEGGLSRRRVWAQFGEKGVAPDGICLDRAGAVWMASPVSREVLRVREGGAITHRIPTGGQATACALGGADGDTLFVSTGRVMVTPEQSRAERGGVLLRASLRAILSDFATGS